MKHQKGGIHLLWFSFFSLFFFANCSNSKTSVKDKTEIKKDAENCIRLIKEGREYWQNDSLGKNGYRILLATEVFNNCNFEGLKFEVIRTDLGRPTEVRDPEFGVQEFIYRVGYDSHLIINLKDSIIIKFRVLTADG